MLRLSAAILLIGGPILALVFRSWGVGSLVFGLGAIVLGIRQVRLLGAGPQTWSMESDKDIPGALSTSVKTDPGSGTFRYSGRPWLHEQLPLRFQHAGVEATANA
jgi:hypothetical protein